MATPNEKLAASLSQLRELQKGGRRVFRSAELSRVHRERLLRNGFLQEVMKGWVISSGPSARLGDSTPWYASFWEFCARYCDQRFVEGWYLSPEQSLLLHAEQTAAPLQVVVFALKGANNAIPLLFGTSLYDLKQMEMPPEEDLEVRDGLRIFRVAAALVKASETFFFRHPIEMRVVVASIRDVSGLLRRLLNGGHSSKAGSLAAAFRRFGRAELADEIVTTMRDAGYVVRERDLFEQKQAVAVLRPSTPPIVVRMQVMWEAMRETVLASFPKAPGLPKRAGSYLGSIDEVYGHDAYHSLSIEGYSVTPQLIQKVGHGDWDPEHHEDDRRNRDALAARGYFQAFQRVKVAVAEVIVGGDAGSVAGVEHRGWYRDMFQPCVAAGLISAGALAGYRNEAVYLRTSRYVPPRWEAVRDAMPALFDLLSQEPEPGVRAVLGHWLFGYVHPYPDGNGRMARFVMNVMLASGGYPWTVIRVEDRRKYLDALDAASIHMEIGPFASFVAERVVEAKG